MVTSGTPALDYLLRLEQFGIKFGLANIRALCRALGEPQTAYRTLLVAGTNGKGSVTAMLDCGLRAAGLKVGRYTSPHLVRLEERFVIDGRPVDSRALEAGAELVRAQIGRLLESGELEAPPTFFEAATAVAFELFREARVAVAVLEVGMGGRLDSTNCVEPTAAAITSIALDHEQYLGHTLGAIAAEKAGIVRAGIPVVLGPVEAEAHSEIAAACQRAGACLIDAAEGVELHSAVEGGRTWIDLRTPAADYGRIGLGLPGVHQVANALVAVRLLEAIAPVFGLKRDAIVSALRDVRWPGRLQTIEAGTGRHLLLDAAHNPAGAAALAAYLGAAFPGGLPIIFGAMRDKDAATMLATLRPHATLFIMTEPGNPRARPAAELAEIIGRIDPACRVAVERDPQAAATRAWLEGNIVCAAGSIFLIGELLQALADRGAAAG